MKERLQKALARAGVASRRQAEEMIRAGRVRVNGAVVAEMGVRVDLSTDRIEVDGRPVDAPAAFVYYMLHKPRGVVSTVRDEGGRRTVRDLVPVAERVYPVGRLDMDSEGLILLTNDGALTHVLTHPRFVHEKEYHVLVVGEPTKEALQRLQQGVMLADGMTRADEANLLMPSQNSWVRVVVHEGRKHLVRQMLEAIGHPVLRLVRVRMGPLCLGKLPVGHYRALSPDEIANLRKGLPQAMTRPRTIAIDGPAASGKSTIGELIAKRCGYFYFDTGVMYRAATWAALDRGVDIRDEAAITALARQLHIEVKPPTVADGRQYTVLADGVDITWQIRTPAVDAGVSPVSAYPGVREALVAQQRRIAAEGPIVMAGRDIGTVVLPDADLKIYLDATPEVRARRRHLEILARGEPSDYDEVLKAMLRRDKIDSTRAIAPLRPAEDAVIIDTTDLSIMEVVARVEQLICPADRPSDAS